MSPSSLTSLSSSPSSSSFFHFLPSSGMQELEEGLVWFVFFFLFF